MIKKTLLLLIILISLLSAKPLFAEEKIPLNEEQKNLINEYYICEEYSKCELETLIKLIEIIDSKYEDYDLILATFVDRLVLIGEVNDWKKYEYIIDEYLFENNEKFNATRIFISATWGWRLYSIREIQNYDKALKLLQKSIQSQGNVEMTGIAYYSLGVIYEQGRAVKKDLKKSTNYYLQATRRGEHYAFYRIALYYILGNDHVKKDFNKAIKYLKLTNISWVADSNISLLKILFIKERLPENIKELETWILSDYKENKTVDNFITLARGFELIGDYENSFKYHYINTIVNNEDNAAANSLYEIKNYKSVYLNENQIENIKKNANLIITNSF